MFLIQFCRQSMIGMTETLMLSMNLTVPFLLEQYLKTRLILSCYWLINFFFHQFKEIWFGQSLNIQVITQIWVLFLGGIGLAGILDVWVCLVSCVSALFRDLIYQLLRNFLFQAGHKFPTIFYLALGGSLLSYIYSAPPLKVPFFPSITYNMVSISTYIGGNFDWPIYQNGSI